MDRRERPNWRHHLDQRPGANHRVAVRVVLRLILEPAKSRVHAVKTLDDLQRVVKSICDAVKTPAGQAIVDTLQEAFARHQHLAICHRLRQRKAAFA